MPDERRIVVVLRDLEGLAYEEIAQVLGLELGTVKSRMPKVVPIPSTTSPPSISRAWLSCAFLGEQPTFDRFTYIRADIVYCFALGNASWQCRHFRPVPTFFGFMNEHLPCHKRILLHRPIPRKTDL